MAADINDKLKKYKSRFSTTLSTGIGTGTSDTLTPATVTGLPTDTAITLFLDRVDSTGTKTPAKLEAIKGVVSGGNLTSYVRAVEGTEQAHSGGAVVEMVWNAADWNDMVDWGLEEHNQDGTHDTTKVVTPTATQTLTNKTLTSPKVETALYDANGNEVIKTPATTSAVNEVTITNSATGNAVQIKATGDDTNIELEIGAKGNKQIKQTSAIYQAFQSYTPSAAATATLDLSLGNDHRITMPAGNITIALSNGQVGQKFLISLTQDATGSRTVTWFSTIKWAGGSAPTLTTTANKRDTLGFVVTGSGTYDGFIVGQNI